ncbi:DUF6339 family protein [Arthrobacter sp. zg-Y859]|uniref:DUF6339 family protein n=1 Tax=Arthrobacter jinronghuae TaxID=2964609 RepID=A0ABT1NSY0_9MICC|nr:DUF6339 family protein [Arthrobacter jinronghuae]MCQ1950810.1 DUF6339 family protein [Arthrobacter jinronghuae]UWX79278.1 DUF6339 family protein [Arthrobacter jinronghuae]
MDMQARAVTYGALRDIKSALDAASSPDDFFAETEVILNDPQNILELPLNLGVPDPLDPGAQQASARDENNAPLVYEYLGALDRANASDRRLWTFLAFVTFREYMEKRWPLEQDKNWKSRVEDRWLMLNATRGKLVRHGIARLWWVTTLTYDVTCQHPLSRAAGDPFAYTREAFHREDRIMALFDRESGALPELVRSVLDHIAQGGAFSDEKHIRALMVEITLVYGYRDLGTLDKAEMRKVIDGSFVVQHPYAV